MSQRIAIGGIWHETNTFARKLTTQDDFKNYQLARGDQIVQRYTGSNTELGGVINATQEYDIELLPTLFAGAVPSGTIEKETLDALTNELIERLDACQPIDGAVMAMHGAAAAEGIPDADAYVLGRVRKALGSDVPLVATYDFHANLSDAMVENADLLIGYDTFPHVDMGERGREAAKWAFKLSLNQHRPKVTLRRVALLTVPQMQATDQLPAVDLIAEIHKIETRPGIVCASLALGFPYSDVTHLGASVLIYGWDAGETRVAADEMVKNIWAKRQKFTPQLTAVDIAVENAVASDTYPVILVEPADNVGGGAAGDCAVILEALIRLKAKGAVIVIADPAAARDAQAVGEGQLFDALVGGKTDDQHGEPYALRGVVKRVAEASFTHKGSYMTGFVTRMGLTAVIEANGNQVVLTSLRTMPFDAEQLRCVGIEPAAQKIIVVKSAIAWRSAYGDVARKVIFLDTPGVCASNLAHFTFTQRPNPVYPLELDMTLRD